MVCKFKMGENEVLKGQDGLEYPLFFSWRDTERLIFEIKLLHALKWVDAI